MSSTPRRRYHVVHQRSEAPFNYLTLCGVRADVGKARIVTAEAFRAALDGKLIGTPFPLGAVVRCANCSRIARRP